MFIFINRYIQKKIKYKVYGKSTIDQSTLYVAIKHA